MAFRVFGQQCPDESPSNYIHLADVNGILSGKFRVNTDLKPLPGRFQTIAEQRAAPNVYLCAGNMDTELRLSGEETAEIVIVCPQRSCGRYLLRMTSDNNLFHDYTGPNFRLHIRRGRKSSGLLLIDTQFQGSIKGSCTFSDGVAANANCSMADGPRTTWYITPSESATNRIRDHMDSGKELPHTPANLSRQCKPPERNEPQGNDRNRRDIMCDISFTDNVSHGSTTGVSEIPADVASLVTPTGIFNFFTSPYEVGYLDEAEVCMHRLRKREEGTRRVIRTLFQYFVATLAVETLLVCLAWTYRKSEEIGEAMLIAGAIVFGLVWSCAAAVVYKEVAPIYFSTQR